MKLKLLWSSLLPVLFCSCSTLPIAMIPHSSHSETDYYWNSGKAVMVSSADSTYVALSAESLSNEVHATVYVRNASSSSFIIDTKNVRVTAVMGNGNAIDAELPCMSPGVELRADGDGKRPTVKYGVAVWTAKEYLKKTENQHIRNNILAAVSTGLASSSYKSEAAQAITLQSGINRAKGEQISQKQLIGELQSGLFQRHTVFPNTSYMGSVRFDGTYSPPHWTPGEKLPKIDFFQVCVTAGPDVHRFLIEKDPSD